MIWIINKEKNESYQVVGINVHKNKEDKMYEVWGTKPDGKTIMLQKDKNKEKIVEYADGIHYAISTGIKTFTL